VLEFVLGVYVGGVLVTSVGASLHGARLVQAFGGGLIWPVMLSVFVIDGRMG
jgi:hypothetical protein